MPTSAQIAARGKLIISIGDFSLVLGASSSRFTGGSFPRTKLSTPVTEVSAYGALVQTATFYEPKHLWVLQCALDDAAYLTLRRIYAYWLGTSPRPALVIEDQTSLFEELSPRTRAIATDTTWAIATVGGVVSYYGKFNAAFQSEPKAERDGRVNKVEIQMIEGAKIAP